MRHPNLFIILLLPLWTAAPLFALSEENIKSAYLERFAMFIEWPSPIVKYNICVYNDASFAHELEKTYASRLFNNRPLTVRPLSVGIPAEELSTCHILYYRGTKPHQNNSQLIQLQKNNVLVISDNEDDVKRGGMISFFLERNAFRFVINQRNLENAHLAPSYKLLNFATVIESTGKNYDH